MRLLIGTSTKMNLTSTEARRYSETLRPLVEDVTDREVIVLPPYTAIWSRGRSWPAAGSPGVRRTFTWKIRAPTQVGRSALDPVEFSRIAHLETGGAGVEIGASASALTAAWRSAGTQQDSHRKVMRNTK